MKLTILYEDNNLLVINKPAGLVVHSSEQMFIRAGSDATPNSKAGRGKAPPAGGEETLADLLVKKYPKMKNVGEPIVVGTMTIPRPGIVHRLDRETSGAIVVAKNQKTYEFLKKQFQEHTIKKEYHAFVYGSLKNDQGVINIPIGRSGSDIRKWGTGRAARGTLREAVTEYEVLARIGLPEGEIKGSTEEGIYTYLRALPQTGRTHQIRVHMKHLNHPIVCDSLYAPNREPALGFKRLALHARALTFQLSNGEEKKITAPFPTDFKKAIALVALK